MEVRKILLLASTALAAMAVAAPPIAQADIVLTEEGTPLEAGAQVIATSKDLETHAEPGSLACGLTTLHFEVDANGANHVVLDPQGIATTFNCIYGGVAPSTPKSNALLENLTIDTWGTGSVRATFSFNLFSNAAHTILLASCHFVSPTHAGPPEVATPLHVTATDGTDTIHVSGPLTGSGAGCVPSAEATGSFKLETTNGAPVELDFVETE